MPVVESQHSVGQNESAVTAATFRATHHEVRLANVRSVVARKIHDTILRKIRDTAVHVVRAAIVRDVRDAIARNVSVDLVIKMMLRHGLQMLLLVLQASGIDVPHGLLQELLQELQK